MVSESSLKHTTTPYPSTPTSKRVFSEIAGDIVIDVDGQRFLLQKFPLASPSGRIRKMVMDFNLSNIELTSVPGGPQSFELAVNFCYGMDIKVTASNVAHLRCIAEYLEMTEVYKEDNLITLTEAFLDNMVVPSLEKSIEVLCSCEDLLPMADDIGIINRCVDAIATNASKEQLMSGFGNLVGNKSEQLHIDCQEWWIEDLSLLRIDHYQRVITAMRKKEVRSYSIISSLMHYAQNTLQGIGQRQDLDSGTPEGDRQRKIVETLISLLVSEKLAAAPANFLFGMLRMAIVADAGLVCRLELEKKIGFQFDMVTLDDLLIPSLHMGDSMFDVDTVQRILVNFLRRIEEEENEETFQGDYDSEPPTNLNHTSVLKVGRLIDGYLAEIAPDPNLKLQKFMAIIEILPDYARVIDDGLYRAIDIYLKAHPSLLESECKKLCKLIDCQKLSQEASNHAAQNEHLPIQMVIHVLYFEQLRLKSSLSDSSGDGFFSQRILSSSGIPSASVSPRDNYASLKRENRELKLEISRMRVRLSDLEKEQEYMKQGMRDGKSSHQGKAFFAAVSKRFGRMGIFGAGGGGQQQKCTRSTIDYETKERRQKRGYA